MPEDETQFMQLLADAVEGNPDAKQAFSELVYDELRKVAARVVAGQQIEPTSIVNEFFQKRLLKTTYLAKMVNKRYFYGAAFKQMQRLLIDRARKRMPITMSDSGVSEIDHWIDWIENKNGYDIEALSIEIEKLKAESPRQYEVVQARFWGGMTIKETADLLQVSTGTIDNELRVARAKIHRALKLRE